VGRRDLRYWCFRFRTEANGGDPATGAPKGLKSKVEDDQHFGGWQQFGVTWDWDDDGRRIVPLRFSLEQTWNTQAWASARDLPE
jgi:hypothetical protein